MNSAVRGVISSPWTTAAIPVLVATQLPGTHLVSALLLTAGQHVASIFVDSLTPASGRTFLLQMPFTMLGHATIDYVDFF
jgi:hypothetical protein